MKKSILLASLIALTGGFALSTAAVASPNLIKYHFICPKVKGNDANTLINDGNKIQGYGSEFVMDKRTQENPFFGSKVNGAHIPANIKLGGYSSVSTSYKTSEGIVSCHYSSCTGFESFKVDYKLQQGKGGMVTTSSPTQITIEKFVG